MQRDVLGDRELEHEAAPLPVLGDVAEAGVEHPRTLVPLTSRPATLTAPLCAPQARDRVDQLGLAVAVDARDADDLAGAHVERDALHLLDPAVVDHVQVLDRSSGSPGFAGGLSTRSSTSRPTIASRERVLGRAGAGHAADLLAAAQHRRPVADLEHLVQLVADEDDRLAVRLEALTIANSSVASCGVSTAVGSSRIRISAPR